MSTNYDFEWVWPQPKLVMTLGELFGPPNIPREAIVTFTINRKRFLLFGKRIVTQRQYRGSATVWHRHPEGTRASAGMERQLSSIWQKQKWLLTEQQKKAQFDAN